MNITYLQSVKKYLLASQSFGARRLFLAALFVFYLFSVSPVFAQNGPNCPSGICIGPGTAITAGSLTVSSNSFYSSIRVNNGATLTVKSGFTLYVGQVGTPANSEVVDFQNGCIVIVEPGASLVVNGLLNNSNNSNGVTFNGTVTVTGNVTGGNGSTIVGDGTLDATGSIITDNTGSIFGSTGDCSSGPCSGAGLCTSFIGSISNNQTICSGVTPATLTSTTTASSPTYQWQRSTTSGAGFTDISPNGTNSTYVFPSGLTQTTYYRLKIKSTCTVVTSQVAITVNNTNSWTGTTSSSWFTATNWSCGSVPTIDSDVAIPNVSNKPVVNDTSKIALANTITVSSGASLTVNSGNTLKVTDKVTNNSGTITFEDSASLVQINTVTNSGNITYKRNTGVRNTDYTYWSSPVSPLKLAGTGGISYSPASLAGSIFYSYLVTPSSEGWKSETAASSMSPGVGYSIRAAGAISTNPPSLLEASFTGVPNNGSYSVTIAKSGASYLLGNPYPSAIDADAFLVANASVISGTLYFWTHNTQIGASNSNLGSGTFAYTSDDYATYNITGGVGIDPGTTTSAAPSGGVKPNGKIGAGQGFFATSKVGSDIIIFNNVMRLTSNVPIDNSQFFKTKNPKAKTAKIERNRVWLNLTNTQGAFKQALVGYITGATNTIDDLFDGESFDGQEYVDFYSINQDKNLTIQGRALPFDENDEVPLGYRTTINGEFSIKIDETDGLLANQEVFLEDKLANKTVNLKEGKYTFNTTAGTFDDRFVLRYANKTLGTTDFDGIEKTVLVSVKNKQIKVSSFGETMDKVTVFDLLGRKLYQKDKINSNEFVLTDFTSRRETYIIKTTLQNGKVVSEKIIF